MADRRGRGHGLLATLDPDVVMNSEREWGFYPTVPGLAATPWCAATASAPST